MVSHGIATFQGPALFRHGFRPFFLGAGIWSAVAVFIWLAIIRGDMSLPTVFAPAPWHAHEMLFGFAAAAVAGFMLTAIPNWTGRMPLQGMPLDNSVHRMGPWPCRHGDIDRDWRSRSRRSSMLRFLPLLFLPWLTRNYRRAELAEFTYADCHGGADRGQWIDPVGS